MSRACPSRTPRSRFRMEPEEMREDRGYMDEVAARIRSDGISARTSAGAGRSALRDFEDCGRGELRSDRDDDAWRRLAGDILLGSTIENARHRTEIPLLVVRAKRL